MRFGFWRTIWLLAVAGFFAPAQQTTAPLKGKKVCVADVANSSMQPIFTDRVKQALVDALQHRDANAENTYTATMLATHLALSANNKIVLRREKCDFMLLSEVAKARAVSTLGAGANPPAPTLLSFDFALFKKGKPSASVHEDSIPIAANDDPTSAVLSLAEKVASEITVDLKSK